MVCDSYLLQASRVLEVAFRVPTLECVRFLTGIPATYLSDLNLRQSSRVGHLDEVRNVHENSGQF
jgi:hypothetical protein